jgi:hypothetical protein
MTPIRRNSRFLEPTGIASLLVIFFFAWGTAAAQTAVTTYHNDNYRTGWNSTETVLTPSNVNASQFGLLATVTLDDQVDAQPLVVPGVTITAGSYQGVHNVVYVVTGNDTVYAIDANVGTVLLSNHLGAPVPAPFHCNASGPNIGITSTPVIDTATSTIYVLAYTESATGPVYTLHALNLGSLTDNVTPQVVSASHGLTNGTSFVFNARYQRQRPSLLGANGNIYAAFGSFCDLYANVTRGWLLGWNATTLAPLAANKPFQTQATDPNNFFLTSIWMSGAGPAADDSGNVLVVTANSDPSGTTYDGVTSIQHSVIAMSPNLSTVVDLFTPSDWAALDQGDVDFGSGGVMVLPDQPGAIPHLAVAAGKEGNLFLMNEDNLGGYSPTKNNVLGTYPTGRCWCGEAYFVNGSTPSVVTSGAAAVKVFTLATSPSPALTSVTSNTITTGQNHGFFTAVSSNGTSTPIVWALSRPVSAGSPSMTLYAFNPNQKNGKGGMTLLYSAVAGQWPNYSGDSNQVPTIANGMVYVASYQQLNIFGLLPPATVKKATVRKK